VLIQSAGVAGVAYLLAGATETAVIRALRPTEWELAWISDVVLATALGVAVYLWRHLQASRQELAARERADLILETQLSVAADIQRRLLPALPSPADGIEWAASLHSAGRIGGDLYDIVTLAPARWLLLVADVSGKGIPAAMALGFLRASFRAVARAHDRPAEVVALLSALVYEAWGGVPYVTCIVARLDATGDSLTWANAGHPSGIVTGQGSPRLTDATWVDQSVPFEPGDCLVLVTDGVTEALGDGEPSSTDRIVESVRHPVVSAQATCDAVMSLALGGHGPAGLTGWDDDRTVVVVARHDDEPREDAPKSSA
jgi:sigma-B regulation protein RsbU (phosphoserine phosphatase)